MNIPSETRELIDAFFLTPFAASWMPFAGLLAAAGAAFIIKGVTPRYGCLRRLSQTFFGLIALACFLVFIYLYFTNVRLPHSI